MIRRVNEHFADVTLKALRRKLEESPDEVKSSSFLLHRHVEINQDCLKIDGKVVRVTNSIIFLYKDSHSTLDCIC